MSDNVPASPSPDYVHLQRNGLAARCLDLEEALAAANIQIKELTHRVNLLTRLSEVAEKEPAA